jgi:hypothetical protein
MKARQLTSDDMDGAFNVMKHQLTDVEGLQSTVLGQCKVKGSVPKFQAIAPNKKFVQVLHTPNHWICATNIFSVDSHTVYVYDSSHNRATASEAIVQLTSLLRANDIPDEIVIHMRNSARQPVYSEECGYFALANAIVAGFDPTLWRYDSSLVNCITEALDKKDFSTLPTRRSVNAPLDLNVYTHPKLHCLCHKPSSEGMIQCECCSTWYHCRCVNTTIADVDSQTWHGPCCR